MDADKMRQEDYNICSANPDGKHGPLEQHLDLEIADTHISVSCKACGISTGYPIAEFEDRLEWN